MQVIKEGLLKVDPGLLLWTIITFFVLVLLLWKTAWKPIVEALDSRAEKIRGDIDNAEQARQKAEKLLEQHRQLMDNSKNEAAQIISKGREEAERLKNEIVEKASNDARVMVERARAEINLAKDNAINDIKKEVVTLSTEIAGKIVGKTLKPEDQKSFVEETLNKIGTVQ